MSPLPEARKYSNEARYIVDTRWHLGMELGIPVTLLGVVLIVVGVATYTAGFDKTIGLVGLGVGIILAIIGLVFWVVVGRTHAPTPSKTDQQPQK